MTAMAGFDIIFELSNETVLKKIRSAAKFAGTGLHPPFDMPPSMTKLLENNKAIRALKVAYRKFLGLPALDGAAESGDLVVDTHMIVVDVTLDLLADNKVRLGLPFQAMTSAVRDLPLVIGPLTGTIVIEAAILWRYTKDPEDAEAAALYIDMAGASARFDFSEESLAEIPRDFKLAELEALFGPLLKTFPVLYRERMDEDLRKGVHDIPVEEMPLGLSVVPGQDGHVSPDIQFRALEVHCVPHADRKRQSLCLFGMLFDSPDPDRRAEKTSSAIREANDGIAISISPDTFHRLFFVPAVASAELPCGLQIDKNSLKDSFGDGVVLIEVEAMKNLPGSTIVLAFHGQLNLWVDAGKLAYRTALGDPKVSVDVTFFSVDISVLIDAIRPLVLHFIDRICAVLNLLGISLKIKLPDPNRGGDVRGIVPGVVYTGIDVSPDGLTIQGRMPIALPRANARSSLTLQGSVVTSSSTVVSTGTFAAKTMCSDTLETYHYTGYQQQQRGIFALESTLTVQPLTPVFSVRFGQREYPLVGATGTVAVPGVWTRYAEPIATGGTAVTQTVHLSYEIEGTHLTLANAPAEGNYEFSLFAAAVDPDGRVVQGLVGESLTTARSVCMEGSRVESHEYARAVQACYRQMREVLRKKAMQAHGSIPEERIPDWVPIDHPRPDELTTMMRQIVELDLPEVGQILLGAKLAHGSSYTRAVLSPESRETDSTRALASTAVDTAMREEMADLTASVADLQSSLVQIRRRLRG